MEGEKQVVLFDDRLWDVSCEFVSVDFWDVPMRIVVCREKQMLFDLLVFRPPYGCWYQRPGEFLAGGEAVMATPLDALFLALPILERAESKMFQPRGVLLSEGGFNLVEFCSDADLQCLCLSKSVGDNEMVHRFDRDRTERWLLLKVERLEASGAEFTSTQL